MLLPIAQIQPVDPGTFADNNQAISDAVRQSLAQTWIDAFQSPLYSRIGFVGAAFAVIFIGVWAIQFLKQYSVEMGGEGSVRGLTELLFPLFVVLILANPAGKGSMLGTLTLGTHNFMVNVSDYILSGLSSELSPNSNPVTEAGIKVAAQSTAANAISECAKLPDREERTICFVNADSKIQQMLQPYSGTDWAPPLYQQLQEQIIGAMDNPDDYATSNWFGRLFGGLGSVAQPITSQVILGWMMAVGAAFVVCLEIAQLITGLVGPLFLGISLLPVPATPWVTWLINFLGISFVDICYKILVGYTAITILNAGPTDPLIYPLIISFLGVLFALFLAAGGGISLFSALVRTGAQLTSKL